MSTAGGGQGSWGHVLSRWFRSVVRQWRAQGSHSYTGKSYRQAGDRPQLSCQSPASLFPIAKYQESFIQEQVFLMTLEKSHLATLGLHSNLALTRIATALLGVIWSPSIHLLYVHYPCDYEPCELPRSLQHRLETPPHCGQRSQGSSSVSPESPRSQDKAHA